MSKFANKWIGYEHNGHLKITDGEETVFFTNEEFEKLINWYILFGKGKENVCSSTD